MMGVMGRFFGFVAFGGHGGFPGVFAEKNPSKAGKLQRPQPASRPEGTQTSSTRFRSVFFLNFAVILKRHGSWHSDPRPIRSELFGLERLEQHARSLARAQNVGRVGRGTPSLPRRLKEDYAVLGANFRLLAEAAKADKPVTSAGEWFLDNFHIVEEQTRQAQRDLPSSFYRELPRLTDGPLRGYPRVAGIAWALLAHSDSAFDQEKLLRFLNAYQEVAPLTIGELWAVPITLRIALVENLRRLTEIVVARVADSERGDKAAAALLATPPGAIGAVLGERLSSAFLARLEQRLRNRGTHADEAARAIAHYVETRGRDIHAAIQEEYQAQAADDISVRNVITTMRLVSDIDWADLFEDVSLVDRALSAAPRYRESDFATRDRYRRAIERLARVCDQDEIALAEAAAARARTAGDPRLRDVGYYLIAEGRHGFARDVGCRVSLPRRLARAVSTTGLAGYAGAIVLVTLALAALAVLGQAGPDVPAWLLGLSAFLALLPASDDATALVNRAVTRQRQPQCLPGLSLKEGVPSSLRTLLVVPTLLVSPEDIAEQIGRLEVHYLANTDAGMVCALLSDWTDSPTEHRDDDAALLAAARDGIAALNARHADGAPIFLLLHRRRLFNPAQNCWMGWERKRGKLHELNRLLRGATDTSFLDATGLPGDMRYVITLDADTRLPRGAAKRLIGKMAHPLNQPRLDAKSGRVVQGHGILQPRVTPSLPVGSEGSLFQYVFSSPNGLDPYAFAVSDVYQDLFDEGSFVGKGIYDVEVFESALDDRIPENTVLSHDLLEGVFARSALVSDIELVEEFPSRYDVEVARQHRWMRGDWQLLPWILGIRDGVPPLGRWKLLDNLRRAMGAPALLLAFLLGWVLPLPHAARWTLFLLAAIAVPPFLPVATGLFSWRDWRLTGPGHARTLARESGLAALQLLFSLAFLARLAFLSLDAMLRTLFRVAISRKRMLEWVTFAQTAYRRDGRLRALLFQLVGAFALVIVVAFTMVLRAPENLVLSTPFLVLWGFSPLIARWASHAPPARPRRPVRAEDRQALRLAARRTWTYFETFVTAEDNWLPPDNFQETPHPVVAHRTSPTNIGAYLCAVLAARDFGWIGTADCLERLRNSLGTMEKLHRYRGHFLNWYDTTTLTPLEPAYVSTVDSGNLMGNLLAVKNAMAEIAAGGDGGGRRAGLADTIQLVRAELAREKQAPEGVRERLAALCQRLEAPDGDVEKDILAEGDALAAQLPAAALLKACVESHARDRALDPPARARDVEAIAGLCGRLAAEMDFRFLFHEHRQLLAIGYRVEDQSLDPNAYDLLASEARLASFLAIAKGDIPTRHWFRLGRTLMPLGRSVALQSWSGSMFEYLMPALLMHEPQGSLLAQSNQAAVRRQIRYGAQRGVPWGISESQYNARDRNMNYQYSGFGVPGLGLKRGLAENLVIAPYASGLAAMIAPAEARLNLDRLAGVGALGSYGWYEAIDYTRQRLPQGLDHAVVRAYMAHHQGMAILGIADVLQDGLMRARLHAEPMVKAAELLLQERMPRGAAFAKPPPTLRTGAITHHQEAPAGPRLIRDPHTLLPQTHLLANARTSVMLTAAGGGYLQWNGLAITRWREDGVRDPWGSFLYLRDLRTGKVWSATHNPVGVAADSHEAAFAEDRAVFRRVDGSLVTVTEICVSPEDDAEVRRVSITNTGTRQREIEITSYLELALARPADDAAHPAFSKLFVETEYLTETGTLLAGRRPRSAADAAVWAAHLSVVEGDEGGDVQYETDRGKFLGRNRSTRNPQAVFESWPLSDSAGAVLDPAFSLRRRIQIPRGRTVTIAFWTLAAASREAVLELVDRYHDARAFERTSRLATSTALTQLQYLGIAPAEADLFQALASHLIHAGDAFRPPPEILAAAAPPAEALWPHGISGDLPILLVRVSEETDVALVRQLARAHDYFRSKHLAADVVILNEQATSYAQALQHTLDGLIGASDRPQDEKLGRILCVRADLVGAEGCCKLRAAARVELEARAGDLGHILSTLSAPPALPPPRVTPPSIQPARKLPQPELEFFNVYGGFAGGGREYVMPQGPGRPTPAPWVNVVAHPHLGFLVSAEGAGFTWSLNSQQNQLTPWSNDPVENGGGEAVYLKDLDDGAVWSPTPFPAAAPGAEYAAHHGQGYSRFEHGRGGLGAILTQFVAAGEPVKIGLLTLRNDGPASRNLAVTYYVEWRLGPARSCTPPILVEQESGGALLARNPGHADFAGRTAFMDIHMEGGGETRFTADRAEFLGRGGTMAAPAGLHRKEKLAGRAGLMSQPCGVLQVDIRLAPGETKDLVLLLGQGRDRNDARALIARHRAADPAALLAEVTRSWDAILGAVEIRTPDRALDLMVNRWLLYQTLSCRMWARAGFYQVSGAYGFRDQLQDCMALCVARPDLARAQLLRAAGRQFAEGDTQHWWLPESGKGIRTRISDDKSWLAYVTAHYVETTGDAALLEETLPFLTGPVLAEDQHDAFFQPGTGGESASLYEHCARALDASLALGPHGLPLIGTGDWNDGMNRIGEHGKGESVWLGWFLHAALARFLPFAEARNDGPRVARWMMQMDSLREALEAQGWDGAWYRRAYFDDGFALGSASNRECRIDSIAQSWGVISGVAAPDRRKRAMEALWKYLVRPEDRLMALFAPPFVNIPHDPGYIKGYPAGIRENGGQYTHGALWATAAFAMMGENDRAGELFSMLNPVNHSRSPALAERYRVEPYVVCADIYSVAPHVGRGGWTWYTGSAAWMYRVALENILGLRFAGGRIFLKPAIPSHWPGFEVVVRRDGGELRIRVENPEGTGKGRLELSLDGAALDPAEGIPLTPGTHEVRAVFRAGQQARPRAAASR
jgi:cyclic beta-1,2-glucan synthetase